MKEERAKMKTFEILIVVLIICVMTAVLGGTCVKYARVESRLMQIETEIAAQSNVVVNVIGGLKAHQDLLDQTIQPQIRGLSVGLRHAMGEKEWTKFTTPPQNR